MARPLPNCGPWPAVVLLSAVAAGLQAAATGSGGYQAPALDRYLPIVSRMPFGQPPPAPPPSPVEGATNPAAGVVELARNLVLFGIVRTPAGELAVGFTDNNAKPPRSLLLAVGEESDGYKVLAADIDNETATLEKDGTRIDLRMRYAAAPASPGAAAARMPVPGGGEVSRVSMADFSSRLARRTADAAAFPPAAPASQAVPNSVGVIDRLLSSGIQDNSYIARLRERREQILKQADDERVRREQETAARAQAVSKEEIDKRLRETNLGLIRKGLKPIGTIELTPEEDADLVAKGILPAR